MNLYMYVCMLYVVKKANNYSQIISARGPMSKLLVHIAQNLLRLSEGTGLHIEQRGAPHPKKI